MALSLVALPIATWHFDGNPDWTFNGVRNIYKWCHPHSTDHNNILRVVCVFNRPCCSFPVYNLTSNLVEINSIFCASTTIWSRSESLTLGPGTHSYALHSCGKVYCTDGVGRCDHILPPNIENRWFGDWWMPIRDSHCLRRAHQNQNDEQQFRSNRNFAHKETERRSQHNICNISPSWCESSFHTGIVLMFNGTSFYGSVIVWKLSYGYPLIRFLMCRCSFRSPSSPWTWTARPAVRRSWLTK